MSTYLPTKSSSRSGRFKKKLVSENELEKEAPVIQDRMAPVFILLQENRISPAEFTALYIITVLSYRYPGNWLGSRQPQAMINSHHLTYSIENLKKGFQPNIQKRLEGFHSLGEIFQFFAFQSTPLSVNRSILNWSLGLYRLELMFRIPKPEEVLMQQKQGRRCVTVILEAEKSRKFILGERDALGFTMHDLIHADHFYHNNHCFKGQLGFYGFLDHCLNQLHFTELSSHEKFMHEFEYLISDMNAYAIHLLKCLKSALIHYHDKKEYFFSEWINKLEINEEEQKALRALNTPSYELTQDSVLLALLERFECATYHKNKD